MLKGVHKVKRRLAGGGYRTHYYAWRGGPKIEAEPGTPEFMAEWQRLTADRNSPIRYAGTLQQVINDYQRATAFTDLRPQTQTDYARRIRKIETEFGDMPLRAAEDPRARGEFLEWRDRLAVRGRREADYCFTILARILSWAVDRRALRVNHAERPGRLYSGSRAAVVWTDGQIDTLLAKAPAQVRLPFLLALWTGQRQGDVLRLTWTAYDGKAIRLKQGKGGRHLRIPCAADLRTVLDAEKRGTVTICATSRARPWTGDGFRSSFDKAKREAGIKGVTFHDLRGTAVTRLAAAGCTVPEIATFTGHSLRDVETILDRHYFSRDAALGESAIAKLELHRSGTRAVNGGVNGSSDQKSEEK